MADPSVVTIRKTRPSPTSQTILREQAGHELVFAIVGHIGSGVTHTAQMLKTALEDASLPGGPFDVTLLKARDEIVEWAKRTGRPVPTTGPRDVATITALQDLGDEMRGAGDFAAIAKALITRIRIANELIAALVAKGLVADTNRHAVFDELRQSRIGSLLEFSRAVHAEMDALLNAARSGKSTHGTRMFVTTFPCHYCARHIVAAGVDEVQYIEPYPKSQALKLHDDSIGVDAANWKPPSEGGKQVLFRPFRGVAPRMYARAFLKDRDLKNDVTGVMSIGEPDWGSSFDLTRVGYAEMEALLSRDGAGNG